MRYKIYRSLRIPPNKAKTPMNLLIFVKAICEELNVKERSLIMSALPEYVELFQSYGP